MKRLLAPVGLIASLCLICPAFASSAAEAKRAEAKKKVEEKKAELNGSEWNVLLTSPDPKAKPEKDTLTFQNGQVTVKSLAARGFTPTNYTITVQEGSDMTIWETMQTSEKEGVVFVRGEWKEDQMRGVISQQVDGGTKDYSFTTEKKTAVPATTAKEEEKKEESAAGSPVEEKAPMTAVEAGAEESVAVAIPKSVNKEDTQNKKKKKWGWF